MTHRPWPIVVIALFHFVAPIINFFMSASILGLDGLSYFTLQMKHSPWEFCLYYALPILAGASLLTFRLWSYYAFLGFMVLVSLLTLREHVTYPMRFGLGSMLGLEFVNLSVIFYFLSKSVRTIYIHKRVRWWQQKPRYQITLPVKIRKASSWAEGVLENISEGGLLVGASAPLKNGEDIELSLKYFETDVSLKGKIIHSTPKGHGMLFEDAISTRMTIRPLIKRMKKDKVPVRGKEMTPWESFSFWAKDLFRSGTGIFPDLPK